jgi:6-pyruvoyl-tetrahydropterin synthase
MKTTCTIKIAFDAAKRLMGFSGACNQLHGYHHVLEAQFAPKGKTGNIVMDFVEIEKILGEWIVTNWDHTVILNAKDKKLGEAISAITKQTIFYLKVDPSAEALAEYLLKTTCPALFKKYNVNCVSVRLYDTPERWVESRIQ